MGRWRSFILTQRSSLLGIGQIGWLWASPRSVVVKPSPSREDRRRGDSPHTGGPC